MEALDPITSSKVQDEASPTEKAPTTPVDAKGGDAKRQSLPNVIEPMEEVLNQKPLSGGDGPAVSPPKSNDLNMFKTEADGASAAPYRKDAEPAPAPLGSPATSVGPAVQHSPSTSAVRPVQQSPSTSVGPVEDDGAPMADEDAALASLNARSPRPAQHVDRRSLVAVTVQLKAAVSGEPPVVVALNVDKGIAAKKTFTQFTLQSGYYGMQGRRPTMEDFHTQLQHPELTRGLPDAGPTPDLSQRHFFAVYDGHGGPWCADYCSRIVHERLAAHPKFREETREPLHAAVVETDESFCKLIRSKGLAESSGATAIMAYIVNDQLLVANVGDSRAVLCRGGNCVALSKDHKPNRKDERTRILQMGGFVGRTLPQARSDALRGPCMSSLMGCCALSGPGFPPYRVYPGGLAISRSIGDLEMKATRLVINTPEITETTLTDKDEFVLLACDGVWDVLTNEQAVRHVRAFRQRVGEHPMEAAKHLATIAYSEGSTDNISVLVIFLRPGAPT